VAFEGLLEGNVWKDKLGKKEQQGSRGRSLKAGKKEKGDKQDPKSKKAYREYFRPCFWHVGVFVCAL
jgi:hypothetical protein